MTYDPERDHRRSIRLKGYDYTTPGLYVVTICIQHRACVLGEIVDGTMQLSPVGSMVQTVWEEMPCAYPGVEIDAFVVMPNHVHGIVYLLPEGAEGTGGSGGEPGDGREGQAQGPAPTRTGGNKENHEAGQAVLGRRGQAGGPGAAGAGEVGAIPCGCPSAEGSLSESGHASLGGTNWGPGAGGEGQARGPAPPRVGADRMGNAADEADGVGATPCGCPCCQTSSGFGDQSNDGPPRLSLSDVVHRFKSLTTARYRHGVRNLGWEPFPGRFWQRNYYETIVRNQDDLDRFRRYVYENPIRWSTDRHNPANPERH